MKPENTNRLFWSLLFSLVGFLIPVAIQLAPLSLKLPTVLIRVLVPAANFTMQVPVDPDWPTILLFFGIANAIIYGILGFFVREVLSNNN